MKKQYQLLLLTILSSIICSCNNSNSSTSANQTLTSKVIVEDNENDIIGSYSLTKNGNMDFQIGSNNGGYTLKLVGDKNDYNLSTPSEADCRKNIGNDYKNKVIDSYYSPHGLYFFKVKKGSVINGETNESGYYFLTYIAGQAWKIN